MSDEPQDSPEEWTEVLGGDELTKLVVTRRRGPLIDVFGTQADHGPGSFWRYIEKLAAECQSDIANSGWTREEDGRKYPDHRDCQPYSDLWYAGQISQLCHRVMSMRDTPQLMESVAHYCVEIGLQLRDRDWRRHRKADIVAKLEHDRKNRKNAPKGGAKKIEKAERARAKLRELAFAPQTLLQWATKGDQVKINTLRKLARDHDQACHEDERLFSVTHGKLFSKNWFAERLSEWQVSGDIERAYFSLLKQ